MLFAAGFFLIETTAGTDLYSALLKQHDAGNSQKQV